MNYTESIAVVVIGRNEGERLRACLDSVRGKARCIVYVDSASSDGSPELARSYGIDTLELDDSQPYTAARSRNAGFARVRELGKDPEYVQFVDGDCAVDPAWLETAAGFMSAHAEIGAVCGRLRERFASKTVYNLLCDMEWDRPVGETAACGGNALMRVEAFLQTEGYRADLIAGEEPELCIRLRNAGWKIWRLPDEMALHDAEMKHFSQWWVRSVRAGYTYAEGVHRLRRDCVRERNRALVWGLAIPLVAILVFAVSTLFGLLVLMVYPLQALRLALREKYGMRKSMIYAAFEVLGRFPEMQGVMKYYIYQLLGKNSGLIEYKKPLAAGSSVNKHED